MHSLQRNESRGVSGSNTWTTVTNGFVRQRELSEVMTNHLRFNFHLVERLPVMDTNNTSYHVGKNNHVSKMCLHNGRFLVWEGFFLRFSELLHQSHRFHFQTTGESSACSSVHDFHELFG